MEGQENGGGNRNAVKLRGENKAIYCRMEDFRDFKV